MNLLQETLTEIAERGHSVDDVIYVGSRDGYSCSWEQFTELADREYDSGYGSQEVAADLEIHFTDGSWLERWEYDGSEGWDFRNPFRDVIASKPIIRLMRDNNHFDAWSGLGALQVDED